MVIDEADGSATVGAGGAAATSGFGASGEQAMASARIAAEAAAKSWRFMSAAPDLTDARVLHGYHGQKTDLAAKLARKASSTYLSTGQV